jgi:hypothetical protein
MMLRLSIFEELERIPEPRLAELYSLIHYFRVGLEQEERQENCTMSLAGAWADMPDEVFESFLGEVSERRRNAFMRRRGDETGVAGH